MSFCALSVYQYESLIFWLIFQIDLQCFKGLARQECVGRFGIHQHDCIQRFSSWVQYSLDENPRIVAKRDSFNILSCEILSPLTTSNKCFTPSISIYRIVSPLISVSGISNSLMLTTFEVGVHHQHSVRWSFSRCCHSGCWCCCFCCRVRHFKLCFHHVKCDSWWSHCPCGFTTMIVQVYAVADAVVADAGYHTVQYCMVVLLLWWYGGGLSLHPYCTSQRGWKFYISQWIRGASRDYQIDPRFVSPPYEGNCKNPVCSK